MQNFWLEKIFGSKKIFVLKKKIWVEKFFLVEKTFFVKKLFESKKNLGKKKFLWIKNLFGSKKIWVKKQFFDLTITRTSCHVWICPQECIQDPCMTCETSQLESGRIIPRGLFSTLCGWSTPPTDERSTVPPWTPPTEGI